MITGATGFAGSFLVELYASEGWRVHGTNREATEDQTWVPDKARIHHLNLMDPTPIARLAAEIGPDVVHHLAAQSSVTASWRDPMETLTINATMQYNLLEAVLPLRTSVKVVVVGSCDEYGNVTPEQNPVAESAELRPANPYALSKVAQDLMGLQYAESRGLRVVRVRPFLQIGPRRAARFVAGSFARQVAEIQLGLRPPRIEVGNIGLQRDFTDVRDMARAYALAAERCTPGEVYNISSGVGHSLEELLRTMLRIAGVKAEVEQVPTLFRESEAPLVVGDSRHFRNATGWMPTISFEQSAADTLDYWRSQLRPALAVRGERG